MKKFRIQEMDLVNDKSQICKWDDEYSGKLKYESIERFILENHLIFDMDELIEVNHENFPLDYLECKKALVVKDELNEIIGFLLCLAYDVADVSSELYLQYIVIHPDKQHQGYGYEILSEFFSNIRKYIGFTPVDIYALIHRQNYESLSLFEKFGFTFSRRPKSRLYLRADNDFYTIQNILNQKSFE